MQYLHSVSEKLPVFFDVLENIQYSSMATFTFMFRVSDRLVWSDKTVSRAMELWCMRYTCFLRFSQFLSI